MSKPQPIREIRTSAGQLLFQIVAYRGAQWVSIKQHGHKGVYLVALSELAHPESEAHAISYEAKEA